MKDYVTDYANAVVSGEIVAGQDIYNACIRHLDDLKSGTLRGMHWDIMASNWSLKFFSNILRMNNSEFDGRIFDLLPWQKFIIGSLFGWKTADGKRQFRVAYIESTGFNRAGMINQDFSKILDILLNDAIDAEQIKK